MEKILYQKHKIPLRHQLCAKVSFTEKYHMPLVNAYDGPIPKNIISFNRARTTKLSSVAIHFYIVDVFFECVWNFPEKYIQRLKNFQAVISTDYSLYSDMLMPEIMWNTFRNKLLAAWWQKNGVTVIPNVSWGKEWSHEMCIDGYPKHSIISINSTGIRKDAYAKKLWLSGYERVLDTLKPIHILRYGAKQEGENESISTYYENNNLNYLSYGR